MDLDSSLKVRLVFSKNAAWLTRNVSQMELLALSTILSQKKRFIFVQAHIVSQTVIRYDNRELLQLVLDHLTWSGLHASAATLAREASLKTPTTTTTAVFTTPKSALRNVSADGQRWLRVTWRIR